MAAKKTTKKKAIQHPDPSYYAIIPASVRYDPELPSAAKLLYGEITALANKHGFCFASNEYFAGLYKSCARSVQRWVESLAERGYVTLQIDRAKGNLRRIYLTTKMSPPYDKNVVTPHDKNVTHNNTSSNTTSNRGEGPESKALRAFETARDSLEFLPPPFFDFFQKNILSVWDKYEIAAAHLRDWHDRLYLKFDPSVIDDALARHRKERDPARSWKPCLSELIRIAAQIRDRRERDKSRPEDPDAAASRPEKLDGMSATQSLREQVYAMSPAELAERMKREKFFAGWLRRYHLELYDKAAAADGEGQA